MYDRRNGDEETGIEEKSLAFLSGGELHDCIINTSNANIVEIEKLLKENSESFSVEFDKEKGFRIFDPYNLCKSYPIYRDCEGWTSWSLV